MANETIITDQDLIKQVLEGDNNSFNILVNRYKASLYWVIYKVVGNATDSEDLTSECIIKAYKNLNTYSNEYAFSTWLHKIGYNRAIDFVRNRNKQPNSINNSISIEDNISNSISSSESSIEDKMIELELNDIIGNGISQLKPFHRSLIHMRFFQDMTYEEISKKLNKPVGTIKTGLFRAKKILYKLMKDNKNLKG